MVKQSVAEPFKNTARFEPQEDLWLKIKTKIEKPQNHTVVFEFFRIPRPALAFSTVGTIVLTILFVARLNMVSPQHTYRQLAKLSVEEQIDYFADGNGGEDPASLGTNIEEYFL